MAIKSFFKAKDKQQRQSNSEAANSSTSDRTPAATTASPARAEPGQNTASLEAAAGMCGAMTQGGGDNIAGNPPFTDLGEKDSGPSQPILPEYPKTFFGKQKRSFSSDFKRYSFIEYLYPF